MKITFVGTGTMGTLDRGTTSILVDDILFDVGCGTTKQLDILGLYTKPIKYIVISHFHAEHFLDLGIMLNRRVIRKENERSRHFSPSGFYATFRSRSFNY